MNAAIASTPLVITRTFDAPVELVYRLWTDPALVARWWGIKGSTIPVCELDLRVGGKWRIEMRAPDGTIYPNAGEYLEIVPHKRLVYNNIPDPTIAEWQGQILRPHQNIVTFEALGHQMTVTLAIEFATEEDRDRFMQFGIHHGIGQSLDRLEELIGSLKAQPLPS